MVGIVRDRLEVSENPTHTIGAVPFFSRGFSMSSTRMSSSLAASQIWTRKSRSAMVGEIR